MTPISYSVKNGVTHFHYKASDIIDFVRRGHRDGNVGFILVRRCGELLTYKGFGTIERPCKRMLTLSVMHFTPFSGDMPTDDERLIAPKPFFTNENRYFIYEGRLYI